MPQNLVWPGKFEFSEADAFNLFGLEYALAVSLSDSNVSSTTKVNCKPGFSCILVLDSSTGSDTASLISKISSDALEEEDVQRRQKNR